MVEILERSVGFEHILSMREPFAPFAVSGRGLQVLSGVAAPQCATRQKGLDRGGGNTSSVKNTVVGFAN